LKDGSRNTDQGSNFIITKLHNYRISGLWIGKGRAC
jgi:hypothetical protein